MELAIPLIALGGMYVISNKNSETSKNIYNESFVSKTKGNKKENFDNMGKKVNYLPNTHVPPQNYPIMNNPELIDTVQETRILLLISILIKMSMNKENELENL
jgi:hypothetical protein